MNRLFVILSIVLSSLHVASAGDSPMDMELPEGKDIMIECSFKAASIQSDAFGGTSEDPTTYKGNNIFHYRLHLPVGYHTNKGRKYPCIFIASPGGNAGMGKMADRLKRDEWVAVMLVESKNGTPDWLPNFLAAHDDVVKRVRIMDGWKFGTGFSGGARVSSFYPMQRTGFRGIFMQGAGMGGGQLSYYSYCKEATKDSKYILAYGAFGNKDFNLFETSHIRNCYGPQVVRRTEVFEAGHSWADSVAVENAFDWFERKSFIELPALSTDADMAKIYFQRKRRQYESCKSPFEKYEIREMMVKLLERYLPSSSSAVKKSIKSFQQEMEELGKLPDMADELKAREKFFEVSRKEEPAHAFSAEKSSTEKKQGKSRRKSKKKSGDRNEITEKELKAHDELWAKYKGEKRVVLTPAERVLSDRVNAFRKSLDTKTEQMRQLIIEYAIEYQKIAKKFPDTVYGKKAARRSRFMKEEAEAKRK